MKNGFGSKVEKPFAENLSVLVAGPSCGWVAAGLCLAQYLGCLWWEHDWASAYPLILPKENASFQKPFLAWCLESKLICSGHRFSCEGLEPAGGLSSAHTMCLQRNEIIFSFYCSSFQVSMYVTLQCTLANQSNILQHDFFKLSTFIIIEYPLGESSQCSRIVPVNNSGSGWSKQESRMWTWWCDNIPY